MAEPDETRRDRPPGRPPLSIREVRFCTLYAERGKRYGYECYIEAGFPEKETRNATDSAVKRLARKRQIKATVDMLRAAAADAALATVERIAQGLARIAFADRSDLFDGRGRLLPPGEWPADVAATVEGVDTEEVFEVVSKPGEPKRRELVGYARKVRTAKRTEALKVLAQWRRMVGQERADAGGKAAPPPLVVGGEASPENL
jgi:phage terminase small subunit